MTELEHDNINRFFGLSIDGPTYNSIWKYCERGTLNVIVLILQVFIF